MDGIVSRRRHRPADRRPARPRPRRDELRAVQGGPRPGRVPRRAASAERPDGGISPTVRSARRPTTTWPPPTSTRVIRATREALAETRRCRRRRAVRPSEPARRDPTPAPAHPRRPSRDRPPRPYPLPRPAPADQPGPLDDAFYDLVETPLPPARARQPGAGHGPRPARPRRRARRRRARGAPRRAGRRPRPPDRDRGPRPGGAVADGPLRARPRAPQRPARHLRHRRRCASGSVGRSRSTRSATACSCCSPATTRPLAERLEAITGRLEAVPDFLEERQDAARPCPRSGCGRASRSRPPASCRVPRRDRRRRPTASSPRPSGAASTGRSPRPRSPSSCTARWLEGTLADGTDDWAIGRERHDALVAHRAFDGLDADAILELGWQQLAEEKAARIAAAREIDPDAAEADGRRSHQVGPAGRLRRPPSTPIATRCSARARTSSSAT